jgi:hypothetical protein
MKSLDKKDMPKVIGLGVLMVGLLGYFLYMFLGSGSPSASPPIAAHPVTPAAQVATATGPGAAAGAPGVAPSPDAMDGFETGGDVPMPAGGKDPFIQNGPASKFWIVSTPKPAPSVGPVLPFRPFGPPPFIKPVAPIVMPTPPPGPPPAPPVPSWTVAGIILADRVDGAKVGRDVAFLRNGGDRVFVKVGDPVGNGYVVAAVHPSGVDIRSGDHLTTLGLPGAPPDGGAQPDTGNAAKP